MTGNEMDSARRAHEDAGRMGDPGWHTEAFPELRPGPPWVMQEMIAAQPALIQALLDSPPPATDQAADRIAATLRDHQPVVVCGCGTSEHAAHAVAALIRAAAGPGLAPLVRAQPGLTAAIDPEPGACLGISHDGGTRATALALQAARGAGARTIAITNQPGAGVASAADQVLVTPLHDDSWCHTVAYTSAVAAGAALAVQLGALRADPAATGQLVEQASRIDGAASVAERLADRRIVLCAGAAVDYTTARELALKIAEGAQLPTLALELETVVHGQLAAHEPADALVLVAITDHPDRDRLARRTAQVARAASAIGLSVAALLSDAYDRALPRDLTPAGRVVIELPAPTLVDRELAGLLAGAGALQALTVELARARHTNPDLIRREQAPYRDAAGQAESSPDW